MRAKELMLGDCVRYDGRIGRVRTIHDNKYLDGDDETVDLVFDNGDTAPMIDPIKLEPICICGAFLEKNGFSRVKHDKYVFADDYFDLTVDEWSDTIWRVRYDCTEMSTPHEQIVCSYVHELQNFLRIEGIEKEVVL